MHGLAKSFVAVIALGVASTIASSARGFAIWQGTAMIEAATGSQCAIHDLVPGKSLGVFVKPRLVGGNSNGSELLFTYELGAFTMRRNAADFIGSGIYDGDAVSFTLNNAGNFLFSFRRSVTGDPFSFAVVPR
jgi:hypothetical protein